MEKQLYFAYGSNIDEVQMEGRCPGARKLGVARLNGYRFIINSRGVASVQEDIEHAVLGILWKISGEDVSELDRYEGVKHGHYHKVHMKVVVGNNGEAVSALVYIAADNAQGAARGGYLEKIISAAEKHGFDDEYIEKLREWGV
jgi:gamma-glutamylcyclotransferase (GGCT)/AIG2-like uncharacterized protein YtfP